MKTRISIRACEHAIAITQRWGDAGIPLEVDREERRITDIDIRMGRWYSGDHCFTRQEKEELTHKARAIMEHDRGPRTPPEISIRECQEAIEITGGIRILLRGEERLITEVRTAGGGNTRWFSGDLRFTVTEQHRLTRLAREILEENCNTEGQGSAK